MVAMNKQSSTTIRTESNRLYLYSAGSASYGDGEYPRSAARRGAHAGVAAEARGETVPYEWGCNRIGIQFSTAQHDGR